MAVVIVRWTDERGGRHEGRVYGGVTDAHGRVCAMISEWEIDTKRLIGGIPPPCIPLVNLEQHEDTAVGKAVKKKRKKKK